MIYATPTTSAGACVSHSRQGRFFRLIVREYLPRPSLYAKAKVQVRSLRSLPRSLRPPRCAALSAQDFKYETMKHRHPLAIGCMRDLLCSGGVMRYMFTCIANIFTMSACYTRLFRSKLVSLPTRAPDMPQVCTLASRGPCSIQSYELIGATSIASCM
jgi:hypothetical protein